MNEADTYNFISDSECSRDIINQILPADAEDEDRSSRMSNHSDNANVTKHNKPGIRNTLNNLVKKCMQHCILMRGKHYCPPDSTAVFPEELKKEAKLSAASTSDRADNRLFNEVYLAQRVSSDYIRKMVAKYANQPGQVKRETMIRFCQQASLIEVAYCWPVYNEDDTLLDSELFTLLSQYTFTREHIVKMDLYFYDLFRIRGTNRHYLTCMKNPTGVHQGQIRRSVSIFNIKNCALYKDVFSAEGVTNPIERVLNRVATSHDYIFKANRSLEVTTYTSSGGST